MNQAVKRNIGRFPSDFMFQLTDDEWNWGCPKSKETAIKINSQEKKRMIKFFYE